MWLHGLRRSQIILIAWSRFTFGAWLWRIPIYNFLLKLGDVCSWCLNSISALGFPQMGFYMWVGLAGSFGFILDSIILCWSNYIVWLNVRLEMLDSLEILNSVFVTSAFGFICWFVVGFSYCGTLFYGF